MNLEVPIETSLDNAAQSPPKRTNPKPHAAQRRLSQEEIALLAEDYRSGSTVPQLVEKYRIHRTTVLCHLDRQIVPRRPNTRKLTDTQVTEAAGLYKAGVSTAALGKQFKVNPQTMARELRKAGVTIRPRRGWKY